MNRKLDSKIQFDPVPICYHEAGHAVIAVHLGIRFRDVKVWLGDDFHGSGRVAIWQAGTLLSRLAKRRRDWRDYVRFYLAGNEAESWRAGPDDEMADVHAIETLFDLFHGKNYEEYGEFDDLDCWPVPQPSDLAFTLEQAKDETEDLVVLLLPKIEVVANALKQKHILTENEVRELINVTKE
jgi:hypothetical protein